MSVFRALMVTTAVCVTGLPALAQTAAQPAADLPAIEVTAKKKQGAKQAQKKSAAPKAAPKQAAPAAAAPDDTPPEGTGRGTSMSSATGPVDGYVAGNTSFGSKTNTPISQVPQAVSVVGRQEIDDQGAQKADEALRYTSGVFAQPFGADSDTNWLFIRGFQAEQTGVFQDGLPLYAYAFGSFYVDSFGLERIEVLKGASSVLYGGANAGGLVNYVSKRPDGARRRYLESGINDAGFGYIGMDVGGAASSSLDYRVTGRIAGGDGYSDFQDDGIRGFVNPTLRWHDDQTSLTVLGSYAFIDEKHNGGSFLPYVGTVVPASFGRISRDANFTEPDLDKYRREQGSIGYELEHKLTNNLLFRQNARYGAAHVEEVNLYANGYTAPGSSLLNRVNFGHDTTIQTFLVDNQLEARVNTGRVSHTLLAGVDYKYFNIDQVQASSLFGTTTPIDAANPVYGVPQTPRVPYLRQDLTQEQVGVYVQEQARFGDGWIVTLNGRYDWVNAESQDGPTFYSAAVTNNDRSDGQASGRAGIGYTFANGLTPYASASTFFNPLLGTTRLGAFFEPETGTQYELGFKYAPTPRFLLTGALFDLTKQNSLTPDPVSPLFASIQTGEVVSRGVELEVKANITDNLRVTGAFTAYDLEVTKDTQLDRIGKRPFLVPEIFASASFDYRFRGTAVDGLIVGGGVRYIGDSPANQTNTLFVPDVTLFDAKIGYDFGDWGIDLNVTNIADEKFVSGCQGENVCSYGEGRTVKLKTHVTW